MRHNHSKLNIYTQDQISSYSKEVINNTKLMCYDIIVHVSVNIKRHVLDFYHFYLYHLRRCIQIKHSVGMSL